MGTKMFKVGSFEAELAKSMEKSLISNRLENKYSFDKIAKVADYLSAAAELLDDTGHSVESEMVTKVLARLAGEDENDAKTKFHTKNGPLDLETMKALMPEEEESIVIEPLEEELFVAPKRHDDDAEYLEFQSIANKLAAKLHKKKV